jgi:HEPN domain-containing protein
MPSYRGWLVKAKSDLRLAEKGIKDDDLTLDAAIFHTQQCAEKALKGFLAYHKQPLMKTHDLVKLLEMSCLIEPGFTDLRMDAAVLSPFATEFRYPTDEEIVLERNIVLNAIGRARNILAFVENHLPNADS